MAETRRNRPKNRGIAIGNDKGPLSIAKAKLQAVYTTEKQSLGSVLLLGQSAPGTTT
jgi:hypothetical protein